MTNNLALVLKQSAGYLLTLADNIKIYSEDKIKEEITKILTPLLDEARMGSRGLREGKSAREELMEK